METLSETTSCVDSDSVRLQELGTFAFLAELRIVFCLCCRTNTVRPGEAKPRRDDHNREQTGALRYCARVSLTVNWCWCRWYQYQYYYMLAWLCVCISTVDHNTTTRVNTQCTNSLLCVWHVLTWSATHLSRVTPDTQEDIASGGCAACAFERNESRVYF